ncbi:MAG TPA: 2TM domain-containing protein [Thermomicrobiales bacterium]|jgi:anti-sigma28 factor (negative regulator of flagellin synthesis)|nr:2TM domain-containing protein [Thermomicrobiales bacterium]
MSRSDKALRRADKVARRAERREQKAAIRRGDYGMEAMAMADSDDSYRRARKRAEEVAGYWSHLGAYLIVIGALIIINLITWGGYFWAIWPAMGWGIGLAFHTWNTFGPTMGDEWKERKAREWSGQVAPAGAAPQPAYSQGRFRSSGSSTTTASPGQAAGATLSQLTERAGAEIDRLRAVSRRIPTPDARRQALEVLASADQIVAALGDGTGDESTARTFLDRYLGPTATILDRYQRLAVRNIDAAAPALRRVEEHDLPLLNRRMNDLRAQIHQGDLIDLEVASEMLAFELEEIDESGPPLTGRNAAPIPTGRAAKPDPVGR